MKFVEGQTVYFDDYLSRQLNGAKKGKVIEYDFLHDRVKIGLTYNFMPFIWIKGEFKEHLLLEPPVLVKKTHIPPDVIYENIDLEKLIKDYDVINISDRAEDFELYVPDKLEERKKYIEGKWEKEMDCLKILNKWSDMQEKQIKKSYEEQRKNAIESDPVLKEYREIGNYVQATVEQFGEKYMLPKETIEIILTDETKIINENTLEKLNKLNDSSAAELKELNDKISEIKAAISICETEESLRKVLKAYKVIDKEGKISVK